MCSEKGRDIDFGMRREKRDAANSYGCFVEVAFRVHSNRRWGFSTNDLFLKNRQDKPNFTP